jgi:membrane-associated phospholipid phosphatase
MTEETAAEALTEALVDVDDTVHEAVAPFRRSSAVRALAWASELGDQPQMRLLAGGVLAAGFVRGDARLLRAGARMLLAHELATAMKDVVKRRVDRIRPRSASTKHDKAPRLGGHTAKEVTSFPSGHSAGALAVARAFAAEYPEHRAPALVAAGAVALAQVPRCAHYPTDIAAGLAIGWAAEAAVGLVWRTGTSAVRQAGANAGAGSPV